MRKFIILAAALWAMGPVDAVAQMDPDWSQREMERMQAQQERFNAQVERQRAEQERMMARRERQAAEVARQSDGAFATNAPPPMYAREVDGASRPITFDRLMAIFDVATDVCSEGRDEARDNALGLLSDDEGALLLTYCIMYVRGSGANAQAASAKP